MNLHDLRPVQPSYEWLLPYLRSRWPLPTGMHYTTTPDNKIWVTDGAPTMTRIYIHAEDIAAATSFNRWGPSWDPIHGEDANNGYWDNPSNALDFNNEDTRPRQP